MIPRQTSSQGIQVSLLRLKLIVWNRTGILRAPSFVIAPNFLVVKIIREAFKIFFASFVKVISLGFQFFKASLKGSEEFQTKCLLKLIHFFLKVKAQGTSTEKVQVN